MAGSGLPNIDRVYCLHLPAASDRKALLEGSMRQLGVVDWCLVDGVGGDHPEVAAWMDAGRVARFPPCFRCGKLSCGSDDCNNVLVPSQVATALGHRRVWQRILDDGVERALIVEDDILFMPWARAVFDLLFSDVNVARLGFADGTGEALVRLGWAYGPEHKMEGGNVQIVPGLLRMSNPCHAVTRALAARLLDGLTRIDTTVDIYTHERIGQQVQNVTVMPPVAADRSWSFGTVASLIHPKPLHLEHLRRTLGEDHPDVRAYALTLERHAKHIAARAYCLVGHPHCGGGRIVEAFQRHGVALGHHALGADGIVSWAFAVEDSDSPVARDAFALSRRRGHFSQMIQYVQDVTTAIPAIVSADQAEMAGGAYRLRHIREATGLDLTDCGDARVAAAESYLAWHALIAAQEPAAVVRVETVGRALPHILAGLAEAPEPVGEPNAFTAATAGLPDDLVCRLAAFQKRYGYRT